MGAREWIDKNKRASTTLSFILVAAAIGYLCYQFWPDRPSGKAWYSTDDGTTWFKDSDRKVPPFDHDGKEAVFVKLYECHGKKFAGYLMRYKPDAKRRMEEFRAAEDAGKEPDQSKVMGLDFQTEYKRPGDKQWTSALEKRAEIIDVRCPHGSSEFPIIVKP